MTTTPPTSIGPIGARQINRNFFVGQSDLTTIQRAVTIAVASGGGCVIIPAGYAGADAISSVTGGNVTVYISDQRQSAWQEWRWSGAAFVPADLNQLTGFIARGVTQPAAATMQMFFDPAGTSGISGNTGTGYLLATANAGTGVPSFQLQSQRSDGGQPYTFMRCDLDRIGDFRIQMPQVLELNNDAANLNLWAGQSRDTDSSQGFYIWGRPDLNLIDLQSETVNHPFRPAIAINRLGGDAEIAPLGMTTAGSITANDAAFDTCEVDNSPVRTFANTADAPAGMIWPPIGIAVSAGSGWGTSINPATLATYPPAGIPQSTGTGWGTPISAASLATWPPAGVPVSTGTAWGTPIPAASIALLSAANIFTANQTINATLTAGTLTSTGNTNVAGTLGVSGVSTLGAGNIRILARGTANTGSANINADTSTLALNPGAAGVVWLSCDQGAGTRFGNAAGGFVGSVDTIGNATFNGNVNVGAILTVTGNAVLKGNVTVGGSNGTFNASSGRLYLNWTSGAGGVGFGNGAGTQVAAVDQLGAATFTSVTVSGSKAFKIPHPLGEAEDLVHACLEGPENGVYYRGEGITESGWAEIILPDYFEALTMPTNRTVMLTALFEDDAEQIGMLAAGRVKEGKFKVWSGLSAQKFYWEVKAVRADVQPLIVTTQKEKINDGTERDGTTEAGEPATKDSHPATTTPATGKRTRYVH